MSTVIQQLYSRTVWLADGVTTVWNFTFTGGYIAPEHITAYYQSLPTGDIEPIAINLATDLIGPNQLRVIPAVPAGVRFTIARVTPRDVPLVNFEDGGDITEYSLDTNAKQAVFIAAEALDAVLGNLLEGFVDPEFGYKSLRHEVYSGPSTLGLLDNGRSHFKTDGSAVYVPNSLKVTFLSTIINHSDSPLRVTFEGGARLQGASDTTPAAVWDIGPRSLLQLTHVEVGQWYISGKATRV
jgi:hypothetical protein